MEVIQSLTLVSSVHRMHLVSSLEICRLKSRARKGILLCEHCGSVDLNDRMGSAAVILQEVMYSLRLNDAIAWNPIELKWSSS